MNLPAAPFHVLITGASSGIGAALALGYAGSGVRLTLLARDEAQLQAVAAACAARGAVVAVRYLDVADRAGMDAAIRQADAEAPLGLVIANAGIGRNQEDPAWARRVVETNILGVLNTIEPAEALMVARGRGQLAIMSSLAAFRAFGGPPGYAASKAWARLYGEALRGRLARHGVAVSVICPGFVNTPMTGQAGKGGMPAEDAAAIIIAGLARRQGRISFPRGMAWRVWLSLVLPAFWTERAIRRRLSAAPGKP